MKQMTEDYVSYEIAVLLKEKKFGWKCNTVYLEFEDGRVELRYEDKALYQEQTKVRYCVPALLAPSLYNVMKWLREVHKIHIDVFIGSDESYDADGVMVDEWHFWTYYITNTSGDMIYDAYNEVDVIEHQTHEEAVEAALLYVLKNLI